MKKKAAKKKTACVKCGSPIKKGYCVDETCPFSDSVRKRDWLEHCKTLNDISQGPVHIPGFNPPIPNMKNKTIAMRIACIDELNTVLILMHEPPHSLVSEHINHVINRLKNGEA